MALINLVKNIFSKKMGIDLLKINYSSFLNEEYNLPLISNKNSDGVIIENFLNKKEVDAMVDNIKLHNNLKSQAKGYYVFPPTCFSPELLINLKENYFNNIQSWEKEINEISNFNLKKRITNVFEKLANKTNVLPLYGSSKKENFLFGNFRVMYEETGRNATSHIHTGHALTKRSKDHAYKHLMSDIDFDNQFSYFILLQNSENGGEITLYDYNFDEYPNASQDGVFYDKNNKPVIPQSKEIHSYKLNPGDMIVFKGGNIYHRVEIVEGVSPRITFGGFITTDFKNKNIYYWI